MSSEKIKNRAAKLIKESQIEDFLLLMDNEKLVFTDLLSTLFFEKKGKKVRVDKKLSASPIFWENLPSSKYFLQLIQHDSATLLLESYFKDANNLNETFNEEFVKHNPSLFINVFKSSRKFFNFKFIQETKHLQTNGVKEVAAHAKYWEYLYEFEKECWGVFEQDKETWLKLSPIELLAYCCYYLEAKKELLDFTFLNTLFSFYFFEKGKSNASKDINVDADADKVITEILFKCISDPNNEYFQSLMKLESWFLLIENQVNTYAYSKNFYLSETDYYFHLNCKDNLAEAKWRLDGKKIELLPLVVESNYKLYAELLIKAENIQATGKNDKEKAVNAELDIKIQSLNFLLDSMQLTGYQVEETFVPIFPISLILNGFIKNAEERYLEPLMEFQKNGSTTSPLENVMGSAVLQMSRQKVPSLPLRTDTLEEFKKIIGDHTKYIDETIQIVCFNPETAYSPSSFSRFNPFVKIEAQPFFQIGDCFLSFKNVMGGLHNSFKTLSLNTEFHRGNKLINATECFRPSKLITQEIIDFENFVKKQFSHRFDFDRLATSVNIHNLGEIDLLVFHNKTLLLVEFKRPYFKTSLKQTYKEAFDVHQKGAMQMNCLVAYFKNTKNRDWINKQFDIKQEDIENILPLIISTSLEQDGEMIDGILKQNFFQFNFHAQYMDWSIKEPLKAFYQTLERDVFWKELTTLYQEYGQALPGYEARISFLKDDKGIIDEVQDEHYYYDLGNEYYHQKKDFNNALLNFEKGRQLNPEEAEYLGSIANCLAEIGQFQMAIIAYEEALAIRTDSFILNNFLVTLKDTLTA